MSKAPAVDYALAIVEYLSECGAAVGISDISNALGINKNAVSRVLDALCAQHWIYAAADDPKKYRLTLKPFALMANAVDDRALLKIAAPVLEQLRPQVQDAMYLGVRSDDRVLYLLHYDSCREVRVGGRVGGRYALHTSAPGKVLLAHDSDAEIRAYFQRQSASGADAFLSEAARIRAQGYAQDREEFCRGIVCVAVPVYDAQHRVAAAIGVSGVTLYDTADSLMQHPYPLLRRAAAQISASLGDRTGEIDYGKV